MSAIIDDYLCALGNVRPTHREWALVHGISQDTLWKPPAPFGVAHIVADARTFQFSNTGDPAVIVPVSDDYDDIDLFAEGLVDLVAFNPSDPSRFWVLHGTVPVLNTSAVEYARPCLGIDYPLSVNSTPLAWLRRDRDGIVVLDWQCCLRLWLGGATRILCDTELLARRLSKALKEPLFPVPDIRCEGVCDAA